MKPSTKLPVEPGPRKLVVRKGGGRPKAKSGDKEGESRFGKLFEAAISSSKAAGRKLALKPTKAELLESKPSQLPTFEASLETVLAEILPSLVAQMIPMGAPTSKMAKPQAQQGLAEPGTKSDGDRKNFPAKAQPTAVEEGISGQDDDGAPHEPTAAARQTTELTISNERSAEEEGVGRKLPETLVDRRFLLADNTVVSEPVASPRDVQKAFVAERPQQLARGVQSYLPRDLFRMERTERGGRASLKLEVAEHEHVGLRIEVEEGVARVVMVAHSNEARAWLQKSADQLVAALIASGLRVDDVAVDVGSDPDRERRDPHTGELIESSVDAEPEADTEAVWLDALPTKISIVT